MKVVFLDIDGVLATPRSYSRPHVFLEQHFGDKWARGGFPDIEDFAVERLNRVTGEHNASIVVSSTWRHGEDEDFRDLKVFLAQRGVKAPVIGRTRSFRQFSGYRGAVGLGTYQRGDEIKAWVDEHPNVENFVVFDDDSDMDAVWDNFVHVYGGWHRGSWGDTKEPELAGLQEEHVEAALRILK